MTGCLASDAMVPWKLASLKKALLKAFDTDSFSRKAVLAFSCSTADLNAESAILPLRILLIFLLGRDAD